MVPEDRASWAYIRCRIQILKLLLDWPRISAIIARAAREILGPGARIYVFGSVVEGKLTADSDLDIAVVLPEPPPGPERPKVVAAILKRAEEMGVPWWFPADIHIMGPEEMALLARSGARFLPVGQGEEAAIGSS